MHEPLPVSGALLVVTHGDTTRALSGRLLGWEVTEWHRLPALPNWGWLRLVQDGDTWDVA